MARYEKRFPDWAEPEEATPQQKILLQELRAMAGCLDLDQIRYEKQDSLKKFGMHHRCDVTDDFSLEAVRWEFRPRGKDALETEVTVQIRYRFREGNGPGQETGTLESTERGTECIFLSSDFPTDEDLEEEFWEYVCFAKFVAADAADAADRLPLQEIVPFPGGGNFTPAGGRSFPPFPKACSGTSGRDALRSGCSPMRSFRI